MTDTAPQMTAGRQRVLTAALAMFSERGFAATSMRDLADELHLQPASLYTHYRGGKEDLLHDALEPLLDGIDRLLVLLPQGHDAARLVEWLEAYANHLATNSLAARVAGADLAVVRHPAIGLRLAQQNSRLRAHLASQTNCSPTVAAAALGTMWWPVICLPPGEAYSPLAAASAAACLGVRGADVAS